MNNQIEIPKWIQVRIYLSLIVTTILFISVYISLFFIGNWIWPDATPVLGIILIISGLIPLIYAIYIKSENNGIEAKEKDFPELFKLIREVAKEFNMKMPSKVLILPTSEIYVTGIFKKEIGIGIIGLNVISKDEFKSILRHEFGHFYGKDTIIGTVLSKIQISLDISDNFGKKWWGTIPIAEIAIIGIFIALFARFYSFVFGVIISIYSRQVEYRADFVASKLGSKDNFSNGLLNYAAYTNYFGYIGYNFILTRLKQGIAFVNIYDVTFQTYKQEDLKNIKRIVFNTDKAHMFSSHPTLRNRFKQLGINLNSLKIRANCQNSAISLINNQKQIEEEFTKIITGNLHINLLYSEAVAREGKCRYCDKQFKTLKELLEHEEDCKNK